MSTTAFPCVWGQSAAFINVPVSVASVATENQVNITVRPGYAVDVLFSGTNAWTYRATTGVSTNDQPVATSQPLVLRFYGNTSFFLLRQSADGVVTMTPLAVNITVP